MTDSTDNWGSWAKHVLKSLDDLALELKETRKDQSKSIQRVQDEVTTLRTEMAGVKVELSMATQEVAKLRTEVSDLKTVVATIKTEVAIKGGIAGIIASAIVTGIIGFVFYLLKGGKTP